MDITTHLLKHKWNLYAHLPQDSNWNLDRYFHLFEMKTVEDTIAICDVLPGTMVQNCMLFLMRDSIIPKYEDVRNRDGGAFSYKVSNKYVKETWRDLTYALVGNSLSSNPQFVNAVTGISISPKKNFCVIKVWMTNRSFQDAKAIVPELVHLKPEGCLFGAWPRDKFDS